MGISLLREVAAVWRLFRYWHKAGASGGCGQRLRSGAKRTCERAAA